MINKQFFSKSLDLMKIDVRMSDFQIGCEAFARDCFVMATIILTLATLMAC